MKKLLIGGVPEHFNLPWYLTLRDKKYHDENINLRWKDYYGGTGEMCKALRDGSIDMAVILTEGIVRDIINGNDSKIVQVFVKSPLLWGIHVAENSDYKKVSDLKGTEAAISRYGSGSHLMSYVNAENQGWDYEDDLEFKVIQDLDGALKNLPEGNGDYFMWEKFTTKPYVDNGPFRLVGECPTPWPCFVIAVRNEILEKDSELITSILETINQTTKEFKDIPSIDTMISNRYDQKLEDVQQWLSLTEWSQENLTEEELKSVQEKLIELNLIDKKIPSEEILWKSS
ncbi:substrate-binding domain-containing protein [Marixanthomonas ophiurae]|uniref:ABC transporter substrate-binding protein n=1 Tax=Marixanthomonas ophiurae TaxID=387659 RepID=A0A3E1Q7M1_9FLAO|nr:substrate-binding domain-containing protein [Marixanthomonas ophiurae]RFN58114.1 ABC transporter substrate-binding protein [Marixanthomonas ophiurae]